MCFSIFYNKALLKVPLNILKSKDIMLKYDFVKSESHLIYKDTKEI